MSWRRCSLRPCLPTHRHGNRRICHQGGRGSGGEREWCRIVRSNARSNLRTCAGQTGGRYGSEPRVRTIHRDLHKIDFSCIDWVSMAEGGKKGSWKGSSNVWNAPIAVVPHCLPLSPKTEGYLTLSRRKKQQLLGHQLFRHVPQALSVRFVDRIGRDASVVRRSAIHAFGLIAILEITAADAFKLGQRSD